MLSFQNLNLLFQNPNRSNPLLSFRTCFTFRRPLTTSNLLSRFSIQYLMASSTKIVAEYAKSNRSSCKKCTESISAKTLRLGLVSRDSRGFDMTKWHHLNCFPIDSQPIGSVEKIDGFLSLKNSDQEALMKLTVECDQLPKEVCDGEEESVEGSNGKSLKEMKVHKADEAAVDELEKGDSKKQKVSKTDEAAVNELKESDSKKLKIVAEYAKSNRSSCKKCTNSISAKTLRLGLVSRERGFDVTKWHHLNCFPTESLPMVSVEKIDGYSLLKSSDQEALKELTARCDQLPKEGCDGEKEGVEGSDAKSLKEIKEAELEIAFSISNVKNKYKEVTLFPKWKAFQTVIFLERDEGLQDSGKIAAFDFDGCLANTSVKRVGPDAWSLLYPSIPEKLKSLYEDGYKLVIFTNESNIERWKNKRQVAVDSKIGRLNNFINHVKVPIQVFIACGLGKDSKTEDPYRKPKPGMWRLMEQQFNSGIPINMDQSFYVGDAAGRKNDHSDADIKFAQVIGLKFHVPEEYFSA